MALWTMGKFWSWWLEVALRILVSASTIAYSARTIADTVFVSIQDQIRPIKWMTVLALSFQRRFSGGANPSQDIDAVANHLHVSRVDTCTITAKVIYYFVRWNRAICPNPSKSVCPEALSYAGQEVMNVKRPIPLTCFSTGPFPTIIWASFINFCRESSLWVFVFPSSHKRILPQVTQ